MGRVSTFVAVASLTTSTTGCSTTGGPVAGTDVRPAAESGALGDAAFERLVRAASAGRSDALSALAVLDTGGNASRSEDVSFALSEALQSNPAAVLSLLSTRPDLPRPDWICGSRAIEPSDRVVRRYYDRAIPAVRAVADERLRPLRDECLASLERTRDGRR